MNLAIVVSSLSILTQELISSYPSRALLEHPQEVLQNIIENSIPGAMNTRYAKSAANVFFTAIALNDMALLEQATFDLPSYSADHLVYGRPQESCLQLAVQLDNVKAASLLVQGHQVRIKPDDALKIVEGKPAFKEILFRSGWMLAEAVAARNMDLVQRSLADPANSVDYWRNNFYPPLFSAIWNNDYEMVKLLMEHGAATSYVNNGHIVTALSAAITRSIVDPTEGSESNIKIMDLFILRKVKPIFEAFIQSISNRALPRLPAEIIMDMLMPMILRQDGHKPSKAGMAELEGYVAHLLGLDQVGESELELFQ